MKYLTPCKYEFYHNFIHETKSSACVFYVKTQLKHIFLSKKRLNCN
jgi:hypothetical protein